MRLELVPQSPNISRRSDPWELDRGRRMIGRSSNCDWQLPEDDCSVSDVHCLIERRGDGFFLVDRSSNGSSVDGVWLREGASAPLRDGSVVGLGNLTFRATIRDEQSAQQEDPDTNLSFRGETLTISSILSDIVPAGQMASGVMGARELGDPFAFIQPPKTASNSSRNVEIGWGGPPEPEKDAKLLPDNWWEETEPETTFGHVLEHGAATRVSVSVSRATRTDDSLETARLVVSTEPDLERLPALQAPLASEFERLLRQLEQALEQALTTLHLSGPSDDERAFLTEPGQDQLSSRLQALIAMQLQLNAAIDRIFSESGRFFDPRVIAARADAEAGRGFNWSREAAYWRYYSRQFDSAARALSAADLLRRTYLTEEEQPASAGVAGPSKEGKRPDEV